MKILQIIDSLATGGAEKLLLDTIPLYREKGIEMDLLVLKDDNYPFMQQLKELNCCKVYTLGKGSVYNPLHIFKIAQIIKNYDIAHVHLFPAQYWAVLGKIISGAKTKLVFTEHNTTNNRMGSKLYSTIDKLMYKYYQKIICISEEIMGIMGSYLPSKKEKLHLIENGINLSTFSDATPLNRESIHPNLSDKDSLLIQVSGFRLQKDQKTLIKSLNAIPENVKLLLVGSGVYEDDCKQLVKQLHLENRVFFLGKRTDVPQLLKTADIIVLSSKYEGLSLSSIEGMASGKPFVASNVPGLKEVVSGAGVLFEQGNDTELAQVITRLLNDEDYYQQTIKSCQEKAQQYSIYKMLNQHIKLYESLV